MSKVICVYFGVAVLRSAIDLKNSRHFLNKSEVKPKPIVTCSRKFPVPRVLLTMVYLLRVLVGQWIALRRLRLARVITLVLGSGFTTLNSKLL